MFNTDHDSTLYKVDLDTISIDQTIQLSNRYCLMGSLVSETTTSVGM